MLCFIWAGFQSHAQNYVCSGDSVNLVKPSVRGDFFWQKSYNGKDWTRLSEEKLDTLSLIPNESGTYRLEITEGDCSPIYSSEIRLELVQIPELNIPILNKVCQGVESFILVGGSPSGGVFAGKAVVDGRFVPNMAMPGENAYYYVYEDVASGCKDSVFGFLEVIPTPELAMAGEDRFLVIVDSVILSANEAIIGQGQWRIVEGEGGSFENPNQAQTTFYAGESSGEYLLEWSIQGSCGSSIDRVAVQFVETSINPCVNQPFVFDADGNRYKTVLIGNQCWMAENLKVGTMVNSTLQSRAHSNLENNDQIEVYAWKNNPDSLAVYGGLYDWDEMMGYPEQGGTQDICPLGWHVPSRNDWNVLEDSFENDDAGYKLLPDSTSGFNAYLSGDRHANGDFYSLGSSGFFWSSSEYKYDGANLGYYFQLVSCSDYLRSGRLNKMTGLSVRCLRDEK